MLTERLPLVWAFAGGCLSGVLLLGFWRVESAVAGHVPARASVSRTVEDRAEPNETTGAPREHVKSDDAPATRTSRSEPAAATNTEPTDATADEPSPAEPSPAKHEGADAAAEQGSSVADVLNRLESQYRQVLAGTAPAGNAALAVPVTAPVAVATTGLVAAAAPVAIAEAPREAAPHAEPAVALAATPAQPKSAPVAAAPEPVAPLAEVTEAAPQAPSALAADVAERLAAQNAGQPRDVYLGNVQNNVYLGNVYQGQVVQMQQELAMLQYMQLLSLSPYARFGGRGRGVSRGFGARPTPAPAFHSDLTNPDNPWGFDFPPTNYVK